MESILEYRNVTKKYGSKVALEDINLTLPFGSIVGLLGPNGSGKTTMLKLAAGLLTPTSGQVYINGNKPGCISKEQVSFQSDHIMCTDNLTVTAYYKMLKDFYSNFNSEKAESMLAKLNLDPSQKIKALSLGTKQKVQLIATMSRDVPLYILDEPIGGVDPAARDYILDTILSNYSENATVIISTHLISDIESVLNHIIFVKEGHIVRQGNADEIRAETGMSIDALFREEFKC